MLPENTCRSPNQKPRLTESSLDSGILNEQILILIFKSLKWDIHTLCQTASVNRRLRGLAGRILWRELCLYRAPGIISQLTEVEPNGRIHGGWNALAKLLFFCGGCQSTQHFKLSQNSPGHFVNSSRFSKTSGRSFLAKKCRGDVLFVCDPCEHPIAKNRDYVGIFRGIFRGFMKSKTREMLIGKQIEFEARVFCPYCGSRVWSMTSSRMIPRRSAARRLGSSDDAVEYFVCLNGHMHGTCWLVPLSEDDEDAEDYQSDDENDGGCGSSNGHNKFSNGTRDGSNGYMIE